MDRDSVIVHIEGLEEVVSFSIEIPSAATFRQLKEKITEKLILPKDGRVPMNDNSTLGSRGFKHLAELMIKVLPLPQGNQINITISIPPGTNYFNLIVKDKQTVLELKQKICSIYNNIGPHRFQLFHLFTEMMNNVPLYKYFVYEGPISLR